MMTAGESATAGPSPDESAITVLAAGDIADCASQGDEATAALLGEIPGTVLALGDLAYETGTAAEFANCYDPSWGQYKDRTLATPGNHEYETPGAVPFFAYFSATGGATPPGWFARNVGTWRLIALNSNCGEVGGCDERSKQYAFLRDQLESPAASPMKPCVLAFWHHPRWSSGHEHGSDDRTDALWRLLADAGADIVLTGHDHEYERFVPMNAAGQPDPSGTTEFVVGTGGRSLYKFEAIMDTSAAHQNSVFGVLRLTLRPGGYDWAFVPASPTEFTDRGSADC